MDSPTNSDRPPTYQQVQSVSQEKLYHHPARKINEFHTNNSLINYSYSIQFSSDK